MRPLILLLLFVGCTVRLPRPSNVGISVRATARVHAHVPPPPPPPVVALEGAPVPEFFGIPLEGAQDIVFVLDCSGSMAALAQGRIAQLVMQQQPPPPPPPPEPPPPSSSEPPPPPSSEPPPPEPAPPSQPRKIDVAQIELVDALQRLPAGTRMNVIFFNSQLDGFAPNAVALDEPSRAALIDFVRSTMPLGSTALAPAMRTAFLMNARRIVLLSDGLGNIGGNAEAVLRDAREAMRGGVRIDTIGLGYSQDASLLQTLARESGGLYQAL